MSKRTLKLILWLILSAAALGVISFAIGGLGSILAYFQQGANPASALNILPNAPPDLFVRLDWLADAPDSGRTLDAYTRAQIETAYEWAWAQWNISYLRKEPYGLGTYFTGPALQAVNESIRDAASQGLQINQVNTSHRLRVNLYSADGNILSLTDEAATISTIIRDASGGVIFSGDTQAVYDMVLLQQEGRWQIRDFVRRDAITAYDFQSVTSTTSDIPEERVHNTLALNEEPYFIYGINYYPQATPWDNFWKHYESDIIDQDFALIQSLGLNTVRIFVSFDDFGGPVIDTDMLDELEDLLTRADEHDLKVIVTLFDFRPNYDPLLWPQSDRHLEALIPRFADNPGILAWDIKNEPDSDYKANTAVVVNAWLAHSVRKIRELAPKQLVTIGWSSAAAAHTLADRVDFVSFHDYLPPSDFQKRLETLRLLVGDKPLLLQEFGLPTWNSIFPNGHTDAEQSKYYADMLSIIREENLAGTMAWTLYDFNSVPAGVAGRFPWQTGPQANLGIVRRDGSLKPAASLLAPDADLTVPPVPAYARFLKPFWIMIICAAGIVVFVLAFFIRRWFKHRKKAA